MFKKKLLLLPFIFSLFLYSCSEDNNKLVGKINSECDYNLIKEGNNFLKNYDFAEAISVFSKAKQKNPDCPDAHWGLVLSKVQQLIYSINALVFMGKSYKSSSFEPEGIQSMISGLISKYEGPLRDIVREISLIEEENYVSIVPDFPIKIGPEDSLYIDLSIQGRWSRNESELIKFLANFILGTIDFIMAHDFDLLPQQFPLPVSTDKNYHYFFYIRDGLPGVYHIYPNFLGKGAQWSMRFPRVDNEYAEAVTGFYSLLLNLPESDPAPGPENSVILYEDTDGNGVDGGDVIGLNIKKVRKFSLPVSNISTPDDNPEFYQKIFSHYSIPYPFTKKFMNYLYDFLDKLYNSLVAVDKNEPGEEIHPIPMINSLIEGIGFLTLPKIPDFIAIRPAKFFESPKPLKDYLPQLIDFPGGFTTVKKPTYSFLIENENYYYYYSVTTIAMTYGTDVSHFTEKHNLDGEALNLSSIPWDCVFHISGTYYPYWQDPSLNGALSLNVSALFNGSCPNDPVGWNIADNYSVDKIINGISDVLNLGNEVPPTP